MIVAALLEPGAGPRAVHALTYVQVPAILLVLGIATHGYDSFTTIGTGWTLELTAFGAWVLVWFRRAANRHAAWPGAPASAATIARWTVG